MGGGLAGLQAAFKDPEQSIGAMVALAKELSLFGFASDYELKAAKSDAQDFTCYLAKLRLALNKEGTRCVYQAITSFVQYEPPALISA